MIARILVICTILVIASAFITYASQPEIIPIRESLTNIPMQIGNWQGMNTPDLDEDVMAVLGVDDYVNRVYLNKEGVQASLYIGYYQSQKEGDTIHSPMNCLPGAGWNPTQNNRIIVPVHDNSIKINRIVIIKGTNKQLVLYWYQSRGRVVASEYWGKIYTVLDALQTHRTDAALVRIICPLEGLTSEEEESAEKQAIEFIKVLFPILNRYLPS